jgi:hypothetical protein
MMVTVSLDSPSCEVTLFDPVYRWFIGTLLDRPRDYTVWSTLEPSGVDSRSWAGIIQVGSATYKYVPWDSINKSINHSQQTLGAMPPLLQGHSLGNRHAAPIIFRMVGAALRLSVYLVFLVLKCFWWRVTLVILNDFYAALVLNSKSMSCLLFVIV